MIELLSDHILHVEREDCTTCISLLVISVFIFIFFILFLGHHVATAWSKRRKWLVRGMLNQRLVCHLYDLPGVDLTTNDQFVCSELGRPSFLKRLCMCKTPKGRGFGIHGMPLLVVRKVEWRDI